jgi:hypothetical protein
MGLCAAQLSRGGGGNSVSFRRKDGPLNARIFFAQSIRDVDSVALGKRGKRLRRIDKSGLKGEHSRVIGAHVQRRGRGDRSGHCIHKQRPTLSVVALANKSIIKNKNKNKRTSHFDESVPELEGVLVEAVAHGGGSPRRHLQQTASSQLTTKHSSDSRALVLFSLLA